MRFMFTMILAFAAVLVVADFALNHGHATFAALRFLGW